MRAHTLAHCLRAMLPIAIGASACVGARDKPPALHEMSTTYDFTIAPSQAPPRAREPIEYAITVLDVKTRQPIEDGEGQLFASGSTGGRTWDAMTYGPEVGTYHAKLSFVMSGFWAVAIRFHRDSLHPVE